MRRSVRLLGNVIKQEAASSPSKKASIKIKKENADDNTQAYAQKRKRPLNVKKEEEDKENAENVSEKRGIVSKRVKREKVAPGGEGEGPTLDVKEEITEKDVGGGEKVVVKKKTKIEVQGASPFPDYARPTAEESRNINKLLSKVHGAPRRFWGHGAGPGAACGEVPNVVQSIVRTILSQNTTQENGSRAYASLTKTFGKCNWSAINSASQEEVAESIMCGGLGNSKAKYIKSMLADVYTKYGEFSLDHMRDMETGKVFEELVSFQGVGPKTASCVLLFCLKRESFAVDTHIFRITKRLGWVPSKSNREQAYLHLDERLPDDLKYPLHVLLIKHGKKCRNCAANGRPRERIAKEIIDAKDCPIRKYMCGAQEKGGKKKGGKKKVKAEESEEEENVKMEDSESDGERPEYVPESVSLELEGSGYHK